MRKGQQTTKTRNLYSIEGGVLKASTRSLAMVWTLGVENKRIDGGLNVRLWLWLLEWTAERGFAKDSTKTRLKPSEAAKALGVPKTWVTSAMKQFVRSGLVQGLSRHGMRLASDFGELTDPEHALRAENLFQEHMPPVGEGSGRREFFFVPRRLAVVLMRTSRSRGKLATTLGHLVRSLYLRGKGLFHVKHLCTRAWIAEAFGVAERTVTSARAWLSKKLGWLNSRSYGWWVIEPTWTFKPKIQAQTTPSPEPTTPAPCGKRSVPKPAGTAEPAHDPGSKPVETAHIHQNLPTESIYQRTSGTGFRGAREGGTKPDPRNIQPGDLQSFERSMQLFDEMTKLGWVTDSLPERVAFAGSARDCLQGGRNPAAMLRHRVKAGLLAWCTNSAESAIYTRVKQYLGLLVPRSKPERRPAPTDLEGKLPRLSADARQLQALRGKQPFAWGTDKFDLAKAEIANQQLFRMRLQAGLEPGCEGYSGQQESFRLTGLGQA